MSVAMLSKPPSKYPTYSPQTDGPVFDWILEAAQRLRKRRRFEGRLHRRANHRDFAEDAKVGDQVVRSKS